MIQEKKGRGSRLPASTNRWMKVNDIETGFRPLSGALQPAQVHTHLPESEPASFDMREDPRGISPELLSQNESMANFVQNRLLREGDLVRVDLELNEDQPILIDRHLFEVPLGHRTTAILQLKGQAGDYYRNGRIQLRLAEDAGLHLVLVDRTQSGNVSNLSLSADIEEGASLDLTYINLSAGRSHFYYAGDLLGYEAQTQVDQAYLAWGSARVDFFYNIVFYNHGTQGHIDANGALLDQAYKSFRDTLDFRSGCVGAVGREEEFTLLFSDQAKSIAVPILLCHEDLVQANHAASNGKIDENILFYLMSRGFPRREAEGLIVESRMRPVIDRVPDEALRFELAEEIHERIVSRYDY